MPGTMARHAEDSTECQQMCANTTGCVHFSFWWIGKHCHLADAYAIRQTGRLGFISGPHGCWESLDQSKYIKKGDGTFVHKAYKCVELGALYTPLMGLAKHFPNTEGVSGIEAIKQCRSYCASTEGCARYTMVFPQRLCRMAGATSSKVKPYIGAVSGSLTCWGGEEHDHLLSADEAAALEAPANIQEDSEPSGGSADKLANTLIMKAALRHVPAGAWQPSTLAGVAALVCVGAVVAWGAVAVGATFALRRVGGRCSSQLIAFMRRVGGRQGSQAHLDEQAAYETVEAGTDHLVGSGPVE